MEINRMLEPENLSAVAGMVLSLSAKFIPGLNTRWDRLPASTKQATMAVLSALSALGIVFYVCTQPESGPLGLCVGGVNWWVVVQSVAFAVVSNASTHQGTNRLRSSSGDDKPTVRPAADIPPRVSAPTGSAYDRPVRKV